MGRNGILLWNAQTRKNLFEPASVFAIEGILRCLTPDFLDECLYEETNEVPRDKRNNLDLRCEGALGDCLQREYNRPKPMWNYLDQLLRESGREPRRLGVSCGLSFETNDRRRNALLSTFNRPLIPRPDNKYIFGNHLSFHSEDRGLKSDEREALARRVCLPLFGNSLFDWGYCALGDEYDANNMDYGGGGACAVGIDDSKMLRGFYWGNYFGPFLIKKIGEGKFASVPGCNLERLGHGILVTNELPPDEWQSPEYQRNRIAAMEHLGRHFFFEKGKKLEGTLFPFEPVPGVHEDAPPG